MYPLLYPPIITYLVDVYGLAHQSRGDTHGHDLQSVMTPGRMAAITVLAPVATNHDQLERI